MVVCQESHTDMHTACACIHLHILFTIRDVSTVSHKSAHTHSDLTVLITSGGKLSARFAGDGGAAGKAG
jgi:hypothetical protein